MRLALAQIDPTVGDLDGNRELILARIEEARAAGADLVALVGVPLFDGDLYNACAICADGEVTGLAKKWHLPNYGVFDEKRYFASGSDLALVDVAGTRVGITICEDMWIPGPPTTELAAAGAELIVNLSASPF